MNGESWAKVPWAGSEKDVIVNWSPSGSSSLSSTSSITDDPAATETESSRATGPTKEAETLAVGSREADA